MGERGTCWAAVAVVAAVRALRRARAHSRCDVTPGTRPAGAFIHGLEGPVVVVPARIARKLLRDAGVAAYYEAHRNEDLEFDAVVQAFKGAAVTLTSVPASVSGTSVDDVPEVPPPSERLVLLSCSEAAGLLGISPRAVRMACEQGRMKSQQVGGRRLIDREDVEAYRPKGKA